MSSTPPGPEWDRLFPGYMAWELDCLRLHARGVVVDRKRLAERALVVTFDWPVRGRWIPLRAEFASTHPYVRPQVFLCSPPEQWPERHVAPDTGNICLLGRDTRQWDPTWSLATLLDNQLEGALFGGGDEDPQGEPAEYWWNQIGHTTLHESFCLVDSDWAFPGVTGGRLELVVSVTPPAPRGGEPTLPTIRAYVRRVFDAQGRTVAEWTMPLPAGLAEGRPVRVPWQRLDQAVLPRRGNAQQLTDLRREHFGGPGNRESLPGLTLRPFAFVHRIELDEARKGDGWLIGLEWGQARDFGPKGTPKGAILPILRAGCSDLGVRVPAMSAFAGKKVAVVGTGALGAPLAIELARNGVQRLSLLDFDIVEPGNSVRWPLGAPEFGRPKVRALKDHIEAHFPGCRVDLHMHALGMGGDTTDDEVLAELLDDAAVVIDASASYGVNRLIWDRSQRRGVPMIQLGATPEVRGGAVVHYPVGGPCIICLQRAQLAGTVDEPHGSDDETRIQPAACGERTFVGADYDLQELSLQAVRQAVAVVGNGLNASVVDTLGLALDGDRSAPPTWRRQTLKVSAQCNCRIVPDDAESPPEPSTDAHRGV